MQHHRTYPMPADVELEDKLLAGLTARQLMILGAAACLLYLGLQWVGPSLSLSTFGMLAAPFAATALVVALTRRDGISLDRFILAAARHLASTRPATAPAHQPTDRHAQTGGPAVGAGLAGLRRPASPLPNPDRGVGQAGSLGIVDLGAAGLAALAVVSTVSFALRTPAEQDALIGTFGRWCNSLTTPAHLLVRALPLDLSAQIRELDQAATDLSAQAPALSQAAADHADYLDRLSREHELLCRQVVLVVREPNPPGPVRSDAARAATDRVMLTRLAHRVDEAADLLAPAGITVTALTATQAAAVLDTMPDPTPHIDPAIDRDIAPIARALGSAPAGREQGWYPLPPGGWSR